MEKINYDVMVTVQVAYPNRKPSDKNCQTKIARYCGYNHDELVCELEREKARPYDSITGKLISYKIL